MLTMRLYLAGNFPQLANIEKELKMAEVTEKVGFGYHRLMTFFYKKHCETVLSVAKTIKEKGKQEKFDEN